jgi:hypothetical protein
MVGNALVNADVGMFGIPEAAEAGREPLKLSRSKARRVYPKRNWFTLSVEIAHV